MTGRVTHLSVAPWGNDELVQIARAGFEALNVVDDGDKLAARLADESFASPHLMQEFCRRLCKSNGISETATDSQHLEAPDDWSAFFAATAVDTSKSAFDLLAQDLGSGPTAWSGSSTTVATSTSTWLSLRRSHTPGRLSQSAMNSSERHCGR